MQRNDRTLIIGGGVILLGVLLLLQNLGIFGALAAAVWAILFAVAGAIFISVFLRNARHWWALIPGFTLLSLGAVVAIDTLLPWLDDRLSGTVLLGGIGLAFWAIYLVRRAFWWAIIPAGVLSTLAVVAGVDEGRGDSAAGWLFFLGLALTFGLVGVLPGAERPQRWAFFPAGACLLLALVVLSGNSTIATFIWPAALILGGGYLMYRSFRGRTADDPQGARHDNNTTLPHPRA